MTAVARAMRAGGALPLAVGAQRTAHPDRVLATCCLSLFIAWLDTTAVNVALPTIGHDLGASVTGLQWVVDAYTLGLAGLLITSGALADRLGRRRVFQIGLTLFALGSLACSLAPNLVALIAARALLAVGGSMLTPAAIAIVRTTFTDDRERARAIGVLGGTLGVGLAVGPLVGGIAVESFGWRATFWTAIPVCLVALALTATFVPESKAARPRPVDPVGNVLLIAMLTGLVFAIIEGPVRGWSSAIILIAAAGTLAALAALIAQSGRRAEPLLDLRVFRARPFSGAALMAVSAYAALGGFLLLNTFLLQDVRGLSPLAVGGSLLPIAVLTIVLAPLSGRLVARFGPRPSLLVAGAGLAGGGLLLVNADAATPTAALLLGNAVFGLGFGLVNPPITTTALAGLPAAQAGTAGAITVTARQVGLALGVALVGAFGALDGGGWWVVAVCGAAVLVLALTTVERP